MNEDSAATDGRSEITRRTLLSRVAVALGSFMTAALGIPLVGAVISPAARREEPPWVSLGTMAGFTAGQPRLVQFGIAKSDGYLTTTEPRAVWVYRDDSDNLEVYNGRCTHLGCLVSFVAGSSTFVCPCHGGVYALTDGRVLDGPPPRALDRLEHRIADGQLQAHYTDYLAGASNQVPV